MLWPFTSFLLFLVTCNKSVNVDEAVDDIVRQFKGVSDGLMRAVAGPSTFEGSSSVPGLNLTWNAEETSGDVSRQSTGETLNSFSSDEPAEKDESCDPVEVRSNAQDSVWHSDNELDFKGRPSQVKHSRSLGIGSVTSNPLELEDPVGMPPEVFRCSS